jgi:hypothetical protein
MTQAQSGAYLELLAAVGVLGLDPPVLGVGATARRGASSDIVTRERGQREPFPLG